MANVLVCDDDRSICTLLELVLRKDGHRVEVVNSGQQAKHKLDSALYDLLVTDIKMPQIDGLEVMRHARRVSPETLVVLMTAVGELETAIEAVRAGAFDYIVKEPPDHVEKIRLAVAHGIETLKLRRQNLLYRREAATRNSLDNIVGTSEVIQRLKTIIRTVAATTSTVLVQGESGTGKELVARAVHACSPRASEPFVSVNCGAFPETLLESELFGYVKGAFTGANQTRHGLFEAAAGGTLFLDEISDMSLPMQVKLLRVLQERTIRMVGGTTETAVDVRVLAATNRDLDTAVAEGKFREDLYYRISVIPLKVPPLRERREDIPLLANFFLKKYAPAAGKSILRIEPAALEELCNYDWPGNVRQLENTIERAVALESGSELRMELPAERPKTRAAAAAANGSALGAFPEEGIDLEDYIANQERSLVQSALKQSNGVQTRAAELLKLSYRSFRHLLKKYEI
jgi:two-component system response regulator PilR (NtrC family)